MWKVTAGRGNAQVSAFIDLGVVAIGFLQAGDYSEAKSREELIARFSAASPDDRPQSVVVRASQAWRFLNEVTVGDQVITYDPNDRLYHLGRIAGAPEHRPEAIDGLQIVRSVEWLTAVSRDALTQATRNSLGAILSIFLVPQAAASEINVLANGETGNGEEAPTIGPIEDVQVAALADPYSGIADQALERVKDKLLGLDWAEMQDIVAALLRALGYRTMVSPAGADRGRDIVASRDGFGFEAPRIVVEVKHRKGPMGAPEVRAFLGGRHSEDRGLYVSTGGFTREAQYEAERASTVTHLMTLDGLARALIEQYESLDDRGRAILPLTKLYWPS